MTREQRELPGVGEPHPKGSAFYLLVDPESADTNVRAAGRDLPAGTRYRLVHVIGRWAGGEVRGYLLVGSELFLRTSTMDQEPWPALDEAVERGLGARLMHPRPAP